VIYKNPVAQKKAVVNSSGVDSNVIYGVKLRDLTPSGYLENSWLRVLTLHTPRVSLLSRAQLKAHVDDGSSYPEQVMTYYWGDRAFAYLGARVGSARLPVNGLKIYVDDTFTGFSSAAGAISLKKKTGEISKALNADVVLQLIGQAIAYGLSGGKSFDLHSAAQHNFCSLDPKGCCATEMGCANALNSAFGDYVTAMIFPEAPRLGESVAGAVSGQKICGLSRDLGVLSAQTRSTIFKACADHGTVALEGAWYASLWWKVRAQAEAAEAGASRDIDILFFEHARSWTAAATFAEAKQSALDASNAYKSGKFTSLLQTVFAVAL
jgi:hypothetical protein